MTFVCPSDGTELILVDSVNVAGDIIYRWECPLNDWAAPWYSKLLSGENEAIPELLRNVTFIAQPINTIVLNDPIIVNYIDDYDSVESIHQIIEANVDTEFIFSQTVRLIRVSNWNPDARILVKDSLISNNDLSAARVGRAALNPDQPGQMWFPFVTNSIHLRANRASEVIVEGYFGNV